MPSDNPYIDPNDPNMGSQDPGQSSAAQSTGQLEDLNRQLAANPQVQAFIRSRGGRALTDADQQQYQQLIQSLGYSMLPNTRIDPSGAIVPNNSDVRNLPSFHSVLFYVRYLLFYNQKLKYIERKEMKNFLTNSTKTALWTENLSRTVYKN